MSGNPFVPMLPDEADNWVKGLQHSPLIPVAMFVTAGMLLDRYTHLPIEVSLCAAGGFVIAWGIFLGAGSSKLAFLYLMLATSALGAARHHYSRHYYPGDDIGRLAPEEPESVYLRGRVIEDPYLSPGLRDDPLRTFDREDIFLATLQVSALRQHDDWNAVSGRVHLAVLGDKPELYVDDEIQVHGLLARIQGPGNPGERDYAREHLDDGIRSTILVRKRTGSVTKLNDGGTFSLSSWPGLLRSWGARNCVSYLPPETGGLAAALLLGETSALPAKEWEKYLKSGVVAVLVVSGQHLLLLAVFLAGVLRLCGLRLRHRVFWVALWAFSYALLTGGRPPAMRAALMVVAAAGAVFLYRRTRPLNLLAFAWLVIAAVHPGDLFTSGCQMSFLCVVLFIWMPMHPLRHPPDPLEELIDESRPGWVRFVRGAVRGVGEAYFHTTVIWIALTPLTASHYHLISPMALLLGPPLTLLVSGCLLVGFLFLAAVSVAPILATPFAFVLHNLLTLCQWGVNAAARDGAYLYVGDIPAWWLVGFYLLLAGLLRQSFAVSRRSMLFSLGGWILLGLTMHGYRNPTTEMRCTFLDVGHGACIVIETPDGRVLLYDAGAIRGPEVTARYIAPYLWRRGIQRIDEVFLSHADLDHFNGVPALLERFSVGKVTCNPSFTARPIPAVPHVLNALTDCGVAIRTAHKGDRFDAGDVQIDVMHPPADGPEGSENVRSLVLLIRFGGHSVLLTGDLEQHGLAEFLRTPKQQVDVLMAPHHGSRRIDDVGLMNWANPLVVVSTQARPLGKQENLAYNAVPFYPTHLHGAVTIQMRPGSLHVETFRTGRRERIK